MARRAQEVSRCPWCDVAVTRAAAECPECLFPLSMAAVAGGGNPALESRGTSSTASPASSARASGLHVPWGAVPPARRSHRLRILAWVLGMSAAVLLLGGLASWVTIANPDVRADGTAQVNLLVALSRARGIDKQPDVEIVELGSDVASDGPARLSVDSGDGRWFAAGQSTTGRCYVLAWRFDGRSDPLGGTLARGEACTGAEVRSRLEKKLGEDRGPRTP